MSLRLKAGNKYGAVKTTVDGITFDSKAESKRYGELKLLERAGEIRDLQRQTAFELIALSGELLGCYRADFTYWGIKAKRLIAEDVKGLDTPLSKWKRKHVKAQYGIDVQIVRMK